MLITDIVFLLISGNAEQLYDSVHNHIFSLPEDFRVYPAHDYIGK